MATKRKATRLGNEDEGGPESGSEAEKRSKARSKQVRKYSHIITYCTNNDASNKQKEPKRVKKEESESDDENADREEEAPPAKKAKPETSSKKDASKGVDTAGIIRTTSDGDKYVELGKKKRATVRNFKGVPLLDIREFYGADGDENPGKKGISLNLEQWEALKRNMSTLDEIFANLKTKK
ncbi:hypothetical protein H0H81_007095 [Sphagnurus paluster]|uniref:Transcriptional coactivator p15 (PC4) C-terminal domain-containing protein n=1 Tax=Sphagnurus paluster TaxID=117069 RepID=A0A9P7GM84_9AGAR|nr:hypothetical protein H0H81_007095 [Sphagnurus paluster]